MATQKKLKRLVFKTDYRWMQVKSTCIAELSILQYFRPSLSYIVPFVFKIFVLSNFELPLKTGFTVYGYCEVSNSYTMVCPSVWTLAGGLIISRTGACVEPEKFVREGDTMTNFV